ncbi:hypothetical protein KGM_213106 [Danaus plexippus plexippus]|uniref:Transcription factor TFIIIC triple barrel domain-containing protein n=1 Tax=Danaus plexippus plexippus TaxID=278856 RepID=A0A212FEC9_DANPL|nr:hypothetical protein KGM_213106 [Danaus plexippus plexippus]
MDNETQSETEEEILVYAEFEDSVNLNKYKFVHVLGIDTKHPVFQLDDTFFTGTYENPLGTYMFFEEDPTIQSSDPLFDRLPAKNLKYLCKTRKLINVEHAYVTPKEEDKGNEVVNDDTQNEDIQPAAFNSIQEALEIFKKEWENKIKE